jgi:hypothetical protein
VLLTPVVKRCRYPHSSEAYSEYSPLFYFSETRTRDPTNEFGIKNVLFGSNYRTANIVDRIGMRRQALPAVEIRKWCKENVKLKEFNQLIKRIVQDWS